VKRTNWINLTTVLGLVVAGACGDRPAQAAEQGRNAAAAVSTSRTLGSGVTFAMASTENISSRYGKAGDAFSANVVSNVIDGSGRIAIPAGSVVYGTITDVKSASSPNSSGTLTLAVNSITVRGKNYPLDATIDSLATERASQGVTGSDAVKVGVGAAAGAIIGQIIDKNTKGTVIGAAVGAAAGGTYAVLTKDADIRLPAGTHIIVTLRQRLTVSGS
jgi:glycine zipper 2TM protein